MSVLHTDPNWGSPILSEESIFDSLLGEDSPNTFVLGWHHIWVGVCWLSFFQVWIIEGLQSLGCLFVDFYFCFWCCLALVLVILIALLFSCVIQYFLDCGSHVAWDNGYIICSNLASAKCANFALTRGTGKVATCSNGIEKDLDLEGLVASCHSKKKGNI